ncbi:MAG: hypothetical protein G01um101416_500 [Microgenomates group bacterium Gr01-1014_16]|nr:MAG: hypothetical protein G01um101416_500 [Microgenomates group bacterium Gr01-1014_16]
MTLNVNVTDFRDNLFTYSELMSEYGCDVEVSRNGRPVMIGKKTSPQKKKNRDKRFYELLKKMG